MMCIEGVQSLVEEDPESISDKDKAWKKNTWNNIWNKVCYSKTGLIMKFCSPQLKSSHTQAKYDWTSHVPPKQDLEMKDKDVERNKPKVC